MQAAKWAGDILFWYALGNGLLMILAFQYYGNLKYHIWGNTIFGFVQIAVYSYGALGAGIAWFGLQALFLSFWPGYIHSKFAKGIHKNWMIKDVLPMMISTVVVLLIMKNLDIDFFSFGRVELFIKYWRSCFDGK